MHTHEKEGASVVFPNHANIQAGASEVDCMGEGFSYPVETGLSSWLQNFSRALQIHLSVSVFSACLLTAVLISSTLRKISHLKNVISTDGIAISLAQQAFLLTCHCSSEADRGTESLVTLQNIYSASAEALNCLWKLCIANNLFLVQYKNSIILG